MKIDITLTAKELNKLGFKGLLDNERKIEAIFARKFKAKSCELISASLVKSSVCKSKSWDLGTNFVKFKPMESKYQLKFEIDLK